MHYGPDETPEELEPPALGPVMLDSLGIYGPNGYNILQRSPTELT
jgi:hypothetical protein